ncbi:MAG: hypothetical protein NZ824_04745 [Candidatus Thioglobus sp.]|nr:hypothetical protein [Candidatus Thioglobus sp.]
MEQITLIEDQSAHCSTYVEHLRMTTDQHIVDIAISALQELDIEIPRELALIDNHWG